jgi:hypothetical protein
MLSRKFYLIFFFLLLLSCRSDRNSDLNISENVMLTLAVPDGTSERYRALAETFMADNEGIAVHIESMNRLTGNDPNPARALAQVGRHLPLRYRLCR